MSYVYPLPQIRQPRSYIYSSNVDALTLNTIYPETRLSFYNSSSTNAAGGFPRFMMSASNDLFNVIKNDTTVATFNLCNAVPDFTVHGTIRSSNIIVSSPTPRKSVILNNANATSLHAFAGMGFNGSVLNYQVPVRNAVHAFYAAATPTSSYEWMRIQESSLNTPQVGIGTNVFAGTEALRVSGDTIVEGRIIATGGIEGSFNTASLPSNVVVTDLATSRISSNILPQGVVYLDPRSNMIDTSLLPTAYRFQYLTANKNVGIGTRNPMQKLHIEGKTFVSERIGIGITNPAARIHAVESSSSIPTMILDNNSGGNLLQTYINGQVSTVIAGTHAGIGIGVSSVSVGTALDVNGNVNIAGTLTCSNLVLPNSMQVESLRIQSSTKAYLRLENLVQNAQNSQTVTGESFSAYVPFIFNNGIATDIIQPTQSLGSIKVLNASLDVDRDLFIRGTAVTASDVRLKTDITRIDRPLERLDYLHGYTFRRIDLPGSDKFAGVLAQEVMDSLPEAAAALPSDDMIGVRYTSLIPLLIEAIHALKEKVATLEQALRI